MAAWLRSGNPATGGLPAERPSPGFRKGIMWFFTVYPCAQETGSWVFPGKCLNKTQYPVMEISLFVVSGVSMGGSMSASHQFI